ncbi:MAG: ribonuclease H [Clostridium sp.]|nr:ribonuclease H [Clostridium sp.]
MRKYYAIKNGNTNRALILFNWEDAEKEVKGAKGVIYKSFNSINDADDFLRSLEIEGEVDENNIFTLNENGIKEQSKKTIDIYVDGSYNIVDKRYSYGGVVVENGVEIDNFSKDIKNEFSSMRNVSGEVYGAINAMKYALEKNYKKLNLYFDYQGIESWALGTWKRNNKLTKSYHEFYKEISEKLSVNFIKVKGHSGDKFNDRADELAKKALDLI